MNDSYIVVGTLVRRKALSSRIVFLDIQMEDGSIAGVCIKGTCGGVGSAAEARSALKVGDVLEVAGQQDGVDRDTILAAHVGVILPWCEAGQGAPFAGPKRLPSGQPTRRVFPFSAGSFTIASPSEASREDAGSSDEPVLQLICPSFVNTGQCSKWRCGLRHDSANLKEERREWVRARLASRDKLASESGDPAEPHDKASGCRRASVFAAWLIHTFGFDVLCGGSGVLDVAGGRGALSCELGLAGVPCTLLDERRAPALEKWQWKRLKEMRWNRCVEAERAAGEVRNGASGLAGVESARGCAIAGETEIMRGGETAGGGQTAREDVIAHDWEIAREIAREGEDAPAASQAWLSWDDAPAATTDDTEHPEGGPSLDSTALSLPFSHLRRPLDALFEQECSSLLSTASALVGMHPDEATEPIVDAALRHRRPFAVVPCCVFARALPKFLPGGQPVHTYEQMLAYLQAKHPAIQRTHLPFTGRNVVLFWEPGGEDRAGGREQGASSVCESEV